MSLCDLYLNYQRRKAPEQRSGAFNPIIRSFSCEYSVKSFYAKQAHHRNQSLLFLIHRITYQRMPIKDTNIPSIAAAKAAKTSARGIANKPNTGTPEQTAIVLAKNEDTPNKPFKAGTPQTNPIARIPITIHIIKLLIAICALLPELNILITIIEAKNRIHSATVANDLIRRNLICSCSV